MSQNEFVRKILEMTKTFTFSMPAQNFSADQIFKAFV